MQNDTKEEIEILEALNQNQQYEQHSFLDLN